MSISCVQRLGLSFLGGSANVTVSVKIGDSWAVTRKNVNRDDWDTLISPWMASLSSTLCPTSQMQHLQAINSSKAKSHTMAVHTSFFTAISSTDLKQEVDRSTLHDQSSTHRGTDIHARVTYVLAVSH